MIFKFLTISISISISSFCLAQESFFNDYYQIKNDFSIDVNSKKADSSFHILMDNNNLTYEQISDVYELLMKYENIDHIFYLSKLLIVGKKPLLTKKDYIRGNKFISIKDFRKLKKQYKKIKEPISLKTKRMKLKIKVLVLRDQIIRIFFKKRINDIDKKNSCYVKLFLQENECLKELDYLTLSLLNILLLHGGWDNYKNEINQIHELVKNRIISENGLVEIIERCSLYEGMTFKVYNDSILCLKDLSSFICNNEGLYFSNIGNRNYRLGNKFVFVPLNPNLSEKEINDLRIYLCIPPLKKRENKVTKNGVEIIFPNTDEWCDLTNSIGK